MTQSPVLHPGDCRETMATLACMGEVFDACVTDPPYDLTSVVRRFGSPTAAPAQLGTDGAFARASRGFMGKTWDGTGIAFEPATWRAVYDVLKPGAHLVAFGATRTYHRMACAIEDAGFEIRDCLMWVYGTGFPKSHDIGKAIDKALGAERTVTGAGSNGKTWGMGSNTAFTGAFGYAAEFERRDTPATAKAAAWDGWGTALKPAVEPIVLARKPLAGQDGRSCTVAANVLAHGTGALNIDGCRIHAPDAQGGEYTVKRWKSGSELERTGGNYRADGAPDFVGYQKAGRWPSNLLHDGSDEVIRAFPDSGSAARFFYCAKAGPADPCGIEASDRETAGADALALPTRDAARWPDNRSVRGVGFNPAGGLRVRFRRGRMRARGGLCGGYPTPPHGPFARRRCIRTGYKRGGPGGVPGVTADWESPRFATGSPYVCGRYLMLADGTPVGPFSSHWAAVAAMIRLLDPGFRSLGGDRESDIALERGARS